MRSKSFIVQSKRGRFELDGVGVEHGGKPLIFVEHAETDFAGLVKVAIDLNAAVEFVD